MKKNSTTNNSKDQQITVKIHKITQLPHDFEPVLLVQSPGRNAGNTLFASTTNGSKHFN